MKMPTQEAQDTTRVEGAEMAPVRHSDIHAVLREELLAGVHAVGARFPGDAELQARFSVGRHTVREALKALSDEGFIDRQRRHGTFVLATVPRPQYVQPLGSLHNLLDFALDTRLHVQSFGRVKLRDPRLSGWLGLPPGLPWLRIAGLRQHRATGVPVCWSEFFLPPHYAMDAAALEGLEGPIHEHVARHFGFEIDHVDQEIGAASVPARLAQPLQVAEESAGLVVVRRYHRGPAASATEELETLTQATLNLFPAGRYQVRSKIERDR